VGNGNIREDDLYQMSSVFFSRKVEQCEKLTEMAL
jgi:hypothetical protein